MIYPRDFLTQFGGCQLVKLASALGSPATILADPDRYLIAFLPSALGSTYLITPDMDRSLVLPSTQMTSGDLPLVYVHATHGALVNIGWTVESDIAPPGTDIFVIVGMMKPPRKQREVSSNGKAKILPPVFGRGRGGVKRDSTR